MRTIVKTVKFLYVSGHGDIRREIPVQTSLTFQAIAKSAVLDI
jgi:hypothetical protein